MKIGFYSPYLDSLGGGERYLLTLASHWSDRHIVHLFWDDSTLLARAQARFHLELSRVLTTQNIFQSKNLLYKLNETRHYDIIFFLSDGSIPTSFAKHNILHFQTPFRTVAYNPLKLWRYAAIVCNSVFTKQHLDPRVGKRAMVIYPPVRHIVVGRKTKLIVNVGRFTSYFQAKKQKVLIEAFKRGYTQGLFKDWKLAFIGGLIESDREYFENLQKQSKGYPISLIPNGTFNTLQSFYQKASIYWHATGYTETDPELAEHFGISTVEAMSAGCIPLVYNGGGQREIIEDGVNGFLWNNIDELVQKTNKVIDDTLLQNSVRLAAKKRAKDFSESKFLTAFDKLLGKLRT